MINHFKSMEVKMDKQTVIGVFVIGMIVGGLIGWGVISQKTAGGPSGITKSEVDLNNAMRMLWEEHITWTRMYIVSAVADSQDTDKAAARLLRNQEDIGNAIKPFYGNEAGDKLTALLKEHILTAAEIIKEAKAGNSTAAAEKKWFSNADEIAAFLSKANPNWPEKVVKDMLYNHLTLTKEEAVARLTKDYDADIAAFDKIHKQALEMADALSGGIVKQFPEKFIK